MIGATEGKYISTDAKFTIAPNATLDMVIHSGTITLNETLWYTGVGQTLKIEAGATFVIPEGKTLYVNGSDVIVEGTAANFGTLILANGAHLKGDVAGTMQMAGGTFETSKYVMIGATEGKYISTDAKFTIAADGTFNMTIISGTITLNDADWWTLAGQTLTIAENAKFVVPAGKNINVQGTVIVDGTAVVDGTVTLYNKNATVKAAEGLNVITNAGDKAWYTEGKYIVHDHTEETIAGEDATCTETGLTAGKKCSVCGDILVAQEEIAAKGHTEKTTVETVDATCTEAGYTKTTITCETCGETISETTEEIPALGHTEKTTVETVDATCTEAGYTKTTITCETCGETLGETIEEIAANGHAFDDASDAECNNNCGYIRPTADSLTLDANNKLVFVNPHELNIYYRVTVYYLGNQAVSDITLAKPLQEIDPNAKTQWGVDAINAVVLFNEGNYVVHLEYNTNGGAKIRIAKQFTITEENAIAPTIEVNGIKLNVTDKNAGNKNHRVTVYYLGEDNVSNIYDVDTLEAIAATAKTYWGLDAINKVLLDKVGNYVIHLNYNATAGGAKITVAKTFSTETSATISRVDGYKLKVTDTDASHIYHRATVYFIGDEDVDIYDLEALKAINPTAKTYWGISAINKVQMTTPGKYVVYLDYNLGTGGAKQTIVAEFVAKLPMPSVWLEENGQIGTTVPKAVVHRNYEIYYLGDQTVEDIRDIDALKAIDSDPIRFDNQKQIAERGVLTEKGNYVLVMYYNYAGSARQYIAEFVTLN